MYTHTHTHMGTAVAKYAVLQIGRLLVRFQTVSLEFFIDIIFPIALWPWGRLSLQQKWVSGEFPGGKCDRCVRLTTLPPPCAVVMKFGNLNFLKPSGPLQACNGAALSLTLSRKFCNQSDLQGQMFGRRWIFFVMFHSTKKGHVSESVSIFTCQRNWSTWG